MDRPAPGTPVFPGLSLPPARLSAPAARFDRAARTGRRAAREPSASGLQVAARPRRLDDALDADLVGGDAQRHVVLLGALGDLA